MIFLKTQEEIELLKISNDLVGRVHGEISQWIKPGVKTIKIDKIAEEFIRDNKAEPGFLNFQGFPNTLCISINEQVVHGIPSERELKDGDIVSIDCGVLKNNFYGDSAYTYRVGETAPEVLKLMKTTKEALYKGIEKATAGRRLGDISSAVQKHVQKQGYSVVREMVGHGVGRDLHEEPQVPNYGRKGRGVLLKPGLVIAIEPMINMGKRQIKQLNDGWTVCTADKKPSAHYEHTVVVQKNKAIILSSFDYIVEEQKI